jgi:predicted GH43/DUF377 family glycosyl hydrolase
MIKLKRYEGNPILKPDLNNPWESKAVFNPAAVLLDGNVYLLYRAMSHNNVSVIGLAVSEDGFSITERLKNPVYVPRAPFEKRLENSTLNSGCEDPRVTIIDNKLVMLYTAVCVATRDLTVRVALSEISIKDFLERRFENWSYPRLISPPGVWDKDAALLPEKVKGKFVFFHRFFPNIWIDFKKDLYFQDWIRGWDYIQIRKDSWDSVRIGIGAPPIKTTEGWVVIYHGVGPDNVYKLGAMLLDKQNPCVVLSRLPYPILGPQEWYEVKGETSNVVFSDGCVLIDDELFVYYGAADKYIGVATIEFTELVGELLKYIS